MFCPAAGTIGGTTVGVAKGVKMYAVRVLDNAGSGTSTTVVNGINWVANSLLTNKIISMSLGGGLNYAINNAVQGATNAGVLSIVAAGNENADACNVSPGKSFFCRSFVLLTGTTANLLLVNAVGAAADQTAGTAQTPPVTHQHPCMDSLLPHREGRRS
jgi:subtilisin family serine protease